MSADVASSGRRMSAWEMREKMKQTRRKSESGAISAAAAAAAAATTQQPRIYRGRRLGRSSSDGNVAAENPDLPPAFRTFTLSKPDHQQIKRAGRRVVTRRSDGTTTIGLQKETPEARRLRRSSVLDSFAKQGLDDDRERLLH